ncbi:hypothetical protein APSETT444_004319 [Aspergillus pseudonomiae]
MEEDTDDFVTDDVSAMDNAEKEERERPLECQARAKLDELSQQVATLSNASFIPSGSHQSAIIEPPPVDERDPDTRPSTFVSQPQVKNDLKSCAVASKAEYEGGTSLSAHAIFATRYLQDVVSSTNSVQIAQEMTSILDTLHGIVDDQKQQRDTLENLYPYAKPIPQGSSIRQLPLPPVEMTLTCLRMAKGAAHNLHTSCAAS